MTQNNFYTARSPKPAAIPNYQPSIGCALPPPVAKEIGQPVQQQYYDPHASSYYPQQYQQSYPYGSYPGYWYTGPWYNVGYYPQAQYAPVANGNYMTPIQQRSFDSQAPTHSLSSDTPASAAYPSWPSHPQYAHQGYPGSMEAQQDVGFAQPPPTGPRSYQSNHFPRRDTYHPRYATNVNSPMTCHRPLVGDQLGPPDKRIGRSNTTMEPVSAYLEHMQDYEEKYPTSPKPFYPDLPRQNVRPFARRRVPGIRADRATDFIPGHRVSFGQATATQVASEVLADEEVESDDTMAAKSPHAKDYQAYQTAVPMDPWAPIEQELAKQEREKAEASAEDTSMIVRDDVSAATLYSSHGSDSIADSRELIVAEETKYYDECEVKLETNSGVETDMGGIEVQADVMQDTTVEAAPVQADANVEPTPQHQRASEELIEDDKVSEQVPPRALLRTSVDEETPTAPPEQVQSIEDTEMLEHLPCPEEPLSLPASEEPDSTSKQQKSVAESSERPDHPEQAAPRKRNKRSRWSNNVRNDKPYNATDRNRFSTKTVAQSRPVMSTRDRPAIPNLWGDNVLALIQQDDKAQGHIRLEERARQGLEFRPEICETFKDKKGVKELALHEKVAGKEEVVHDGGANNKAEANNRGEPVNGGSAYHENPGLGKYLATAKAVRVGDGDSQKFKSEVAAVEAESGSGTAQIKREVESSGSEPGGGIKIDGE